jgi:outer membrane protein OmpA-like peptidoglycan-associated protein
MARPILEDEEQQPKVPGWAYTYIDLLWLLLVFFILRIAVSEVCDGPLYRKMAAAMKHRFGVEAEATAAGGSMKNTDGKTKTQYGEIVKEGWDAAAETRRRTLALRGTVYFSAGEDGLQSEQKQILQAVAKQVGRSRDQIEIRAEAEAKSSEGENANRPAVDPPYARCVAARDYLVRLGIDPQKLRIAVIPAERSASDRPCVRLYCVSEISAEASAKKPAKR